MKHAEFCYWLQGYFEITEASSNRPPEGMTTNQVEVVRRHLNMVFLLQSGELPNGEIAKQLKLQPGC